MTAASEKWHLGRASGIILLLAVLSVSGCVTDSIPKKPPLAAAPVVLQTPEPPSASLESINPGSLWQKDAALNDMFSNVKARRVGDIVTVRIVESAEAINKATTKTDRDSSINAQLNAFFNLEKKFPDTRTDFNPFAQVKSGIQSDFKGTGETKRSGEFTAYISARVNAITSTGNLLIAGSRSVTINNEEQIISLSGIIRPKDISPNNEVLSRHVSDAQIYYSGAGVINDRQKPGMLTRVFDTIWPF
ncbi:MAG: flagellar basal body L-ring protein FlgH [Pseudomonadota bacterium]